MNLLELLKVTSAAHGVMITEYSEEERAEIILDYIKNDICFKDFRRCIIKYREREVAYIKAKNDKIVVLLKRGKG